MSPYELRAQIKKEPVAGAPSQHAPFVLRCLAIYQVAKAGFLFLIFMQIWAKHEAESSVGNTTYDPLFSEPGFFLFPLVALMFLLIAWGIWKAQEWARVCTIVLLATLCVFWWRWGAQDVLIPWIYKEPNFVTAVLLIELTSIAALYLLESVTNAFDRAKNS